MPRSEVKLFKLFIYRLLKYLINVKNELGGVKMGISMCPQ